MLVIEERDRTEPFMTTLGSWISGREAAGDEGRREARRHLLEVYAAPLENYLRSTSWGSWGDPRDHVHEFLLSRIEDPDFLRPWLKQRHEFPLRKWLASRLIFHVRTEYKKHTGRPSISIETIEPLDDGPNPADEAAKMEVRTWISHIVQFALLRTKSKCLELGFEVNWRCFELHYLQGMRFKEVAQKLRITPEHKAREYSRAARDRFREHVRTLMIKDGTARSQVDDAILSFLGTNKP